MQRRRSRTCPGWLDAPATTTPSRLEQRAEVIASTHVTAASSTSASTAIGRPSTTMSGLRSTDATSGRDLGQARRGRATRRPARRGRRGLATERSEQRLRGEVVDQSVGVDRVERHQAEHDVADRFGEHAADAEHHGQPELRVVDQTGDELTVAAEHRRHEQVTGPSSGVAAASSSVAAARTAAASRDGEAHAGRARSCGRWRRRSA